MNFETKFNKNDRVWFMKNNKPIKAIVSAIEIFYVATDQDHIKYNAQDAVNPVSWLDHTNLFENMLFKSKTALLESLFSDRIERKKYKGKNCNAVNGKGHSKERTKEHEDCVTTND